MLIVARRRFANINVICLCVSESSVSFLYSVLKLNVTFGRLSWNRYISVLAIVYRPLVSFFRFAHNSRFILLRLAQIKFEHSSIQFNSSAWIQYQLIHNTYHKQIPLCLWLLGQRYQPHMESIHIRFQK